MTAIPDISVVLPTYERARMVEAAIESLLRQRGPAPRFEVLVIDNNSTDGTREVVDAFVRDGFRNIQYFLERRQGVSYARNTGIRAARAPIVAFTDDDQQVAPDWVATIKRVMDQHPELDFIGGKVLPRWECSPPAWVTRDHWGAMGLIDRGDEPFRVDANRHGYLGSGNLAVRRAVFDEVGAFDPDYQRVKDGIGSIEDHEFMLRLRNSGKVGMYVPELLATSAVPRERVTRAYHRRWQSGNGVYCARVRLLAPPDGAVALFGLPTWEYRTLLGHVGRWGWFRVSGNDAAAFNHELRLRWTWNYIRASGRMPDAPPAGEQIVSAVKCVMKNRYRSFKQRLTHGTR